MLEQRWLGRRKWQGRQVDMWNTLRDRIRKHPEKFQCVPNVPFQLRAIFLFGSKINLVSLPIDPKYQYLTPAGSNAKDCWHGIKAIRQAEHFKPEQELLPEECFYFTREISGI
jgi:hypothetical protein